MVRIANSGTVTDLDAIHDNVSGEIVAITEKTTLVDDDLFLIEDSESSNAKKRVKKSNISSAFKGVRVYQGTVNTTSITSTPKVLDFDTEVFDTDSLHDNVSNNSRLTADETAYYSIFGQVSSNDPNVDMIFFKVRIRKNGTGSIADQVFLWDPNTTNSTVEIQVASGPILLTSGDYVELMAAFLPTDDSSLGESSTWFAMYKLGV